MAAAMLSDAGYEVGEVSSGDAAFDVLKHSSSRVELMVADVAARGTRWRGACCDRAAYLAQFAGAFHHWVWGHGFG